MGREGTQEEVAEAVVQQTGRADLLTATSCAILLGVNVSTLIGWLDAGDPDGAAPPAIKRGARYVFRPAIVAPWLREHGYHVPPSLWERAAKEERAA